MTSSSLKYGAALVLAALLVTSPRFAYADEQPAAEPPRAKLELGSPFVDNAILQRQIDVPVWGWSEPGSTVTVHFADQAKTASADEFGKWIVKLDPLEASSEERALRVSSSAGESLTRQGVLVGEVWFASGQSNMDWIAGKSMCRGLAGELARASEDVPIREFRTDTGSAVFPQTRVTSEEGWKKARQAGSFSALALSFAYRLHEELGAPIGILRSSHGATRVEPWTPYEGFADHPQLQDIALRIRRSDPSTADGRQAYEQFFEDLKQWRRDGEERIERMRAAGAMDCSLTWLRHGETYLPRPGTVLPRPNLPGIAADWKGASRMYNRKVHPLIPYAIRGMIWCQGTHNAGDGRIYAAKMEALVRGIRKEWNRPDLPFYFTQMQCYGEPDPEKAGFADIREAQRLFFMNNASNHVGMVLQHDLNSARPTGIHYFNKLHPGQRLARWALAHDYGKDIAYTGPIYHSHTIEDSTVRVRFEQPGPGGGLMVGSKGMAADYREDPPAYFEPARPTPDEELRHFRLAGNDGVWHAADAVIEGRAVIVTCEAVPEPVGVQYAYSASPIGANLYNEAGLPATPFAYFDGQQLFQEDLPDVRARAKVREEAGDSPPPVSPYLQVMTPLRRGAVIQRNMPVPVWGFARPGAEVTVRFGDQTKKTVVSEFDQWRVDLDPMPAATAGRPLTIACSNGPAATIEDVVVGDVWVLTGGTAVSGEPAFSGKDKEATPTAMPRLREFKIRTKARRFRTPRKRRMEIGGGKYVSSWRSALFTENERDTSAAGYFFASQVAEEDVPVGVITLGADNPPLTWISYQGMQNARGFEAERDELNLLYPNTDACKAAVTEYIETLKRYMSDIVALRDAGRDIPGELGESPPAFPQPYYNQWSNETESATHTYNFCISPNTPLAVKGVAWMPGPKSIGQDVSRYAAALEAYAASLPETYGQEHVAFVYAQPSAGLVDGIARPRIDGAASIEFDQWPQSLKEIATRLGAVAATKRK